jgi:probable addiction module antidote protein
MSKETFGRYNTADYLKTEEQIVAYLEAIMDEAGDDPAVIAHALGTVARARNMSRLARDTGMTREGLYKALSGEGNPSFATVLKVAHALGLQMVFRPMGAKQDEAPITPTAPEGRGKAAGTRKDLTP